MMKNYEEYLAIAHKEAATAQKLEQNGANMWDVYASPARYLEGTFSRLLERLPEGSTDRPLLSVMKARKRQHGSLFVLEAMGQGRFYVDYPVDGEVTNSLTNPRNELEQLMDRQHGMEFVPGDILDPETQRGIDSCIDAQKERMQGGFDFTFCRPKMGWSVVIPDDHAQSQEFVQYMQWAVTDALYRRTSPHEGKLLIDYTWRSTNPQPLFDTLEATPGIQLATDAKLMMLTRTPEAPTTLPLPLLAAA